jgi:ElaB/YqjD/DUF883 family membrane-anchored ribosome-binding protein
MPEMDPYSSTGLQDRPEQDAKTRVKEVASQAKAKAADLANKASEYGRSALNKVDEKRTTAASALDSTASGLRSSGERVTHWGGAAAEKIENTARYLREHDTRRMASDLESTVRRNPGPSILIAAALGFFLGSALRRSE